MSSLYSHSEFSLQEGEVLTPSISLLRITHCGRGCILCSWPLRIRSLLTPLLVETKPRRLRRAGDSLRPLRRAFPVASLAPSGLGKTWRKPLSLSLSAISSLTLVFDYGNSIILLLLRRRQQRRRLRGRNCNGAAKKPFRNHACARARSLDSNY